MACPSDERYTSDSYSGKMSVNAQAGMTVVLASALELPLPTAIAGTLQTFHESADVFEWFSSHDPRLLRLDIRKMVYHLASEKLKNMWLLGQLVSPIRQYAHVTMGTHVS